MDKPIIVCPTWIKIVKKVKKPEEKVVVEK